MVEMSADAVFPLEEEGLVLIDRAAGEIGLWSKAHPRELRRIALRGSPVCETYAPEAKKLFLGYEDGSLTVVALGMTGGAAPKEIPFARHPVAPLSLLCAGTLLVVQENKDGTWAAHTVYSAEGRKLGRREQAFLSRSWVWSGRQRRLFFLSSSVSPADINYEEILSGGTFGKTGDSPYHDSQGMVGPLQLMDRDTSVVLGSGRVYKTTSLELELTLPVPVLVLRSLDKKFYVLAESRANARSLYVDYGRPMTEAVVHRLSASYDIEATVKLPGQPVGLGVWPHGLVIPVKEKKSTRLYWCDPDLVVQPLEPKPAT